MTANNVLKLHPESVAEKFGRIVEKLFQILIADRHLEIFIKDAQATGKLLDHRSEQAQFTDHLFDAVGLMTRQTF